MVKKVDLTGRRFGRLTVLGDVGKRNPRKAILWQCRCDCGKIAFARGDHLKNGKIKSCGCLNKDKKQGRFKDLSNYENDNFKVLKKVESKNQRAMWLCKCKHCGNTIELHSNNINKYHSCGCLRTGASKEYMESIRDVESLKSTKPTKKSTTGVRGVYYQKKKHSYQAFINVNKKEKYLGSFKTLEEAAKARKEAEKEFWNK
ncbi:MULTISPECIES: AP2 domain-containing protein [Streptococcus]|uniref:AP2 domain-containing protein n=1 Tax=Streptococcus equinus JB1 TaxID=1294274 RepID=A0A091CBN9_STREI|nr:MULTISPECIES: AP2 domain-containing protein [Streptococcus]KFN88913.1 hypothetical protein H702_00415 [Streptococcus equinus JB1]SFL25440.1 AP2 domain-containing protein [Streptococcus equinus JB1]